MPFIKGIGVPELVIILVIILILFGPKRLPQLGKMLGKTVRNVRDGIEGKLEAGEEAETFEADASEKGETVEASAKPEEKQA